MTNVASQKVLAACLFVLGLAMALQVFLHFSPGAMSPDSLHILAQARSGVFEDGHPPLLAALWRVSDHFVPGPIGVLVLNLVLFYGGLYTIFAWGLQRYGPWVFPAFLVVGTFPSIIGILGVIWIDITMAGFFLAAIGMGLAGYASPGRRVRIGGLSIALLFVALGCAVRHNGAAAAFPMVAFLVVRGVSDRTGSLKRLAFAVFGGLAITFGAFLASRQVSARYVDVDRHLWRTAAMYDIAGVSYQERKNLFYPDVAVQCNLADISALYSPRSYFPLVLGRQIHPLPGVLTYVEANAFRFNLANPLLDQRLRDNWARAIVRHPRAYLTHRYDVFVSLVTRSHWGLWAPVYDIIEPNDLGIPERVAADSYYYAVVKELSKNSVVFVPLLFLVSSAVMVIPTCVLGLRYRLDTLLLASALYASGMTHMLGLFFLVASADFRYSHWLITATVLATSLVALECAHALRRGFESHSR